MKVSELMNPRAYCSMQRSIILPTRSAFWSSCRRHRRYHQRQCLLQCGQLPGNVRRHNGHRGRHCAAPRLQRGRVRTGHLALLLRRGVDWGAPDGKPVDLVFMIAVPPGSESLHLQILARLVNLMSAATLSEA